MEGTQLHPVALAYPSPSWPTSLAPQQYKLLPEERAHISESPANMAITPVSAGVPGGVNTLAVLPVPSWPLKPYPQQYTPPDDVRIHV